MSDDSERHPMRVLLLVLLVAFVGVLAYGVVRFDWLQRPDSAVETVAVWTKPPLEEEAALDVDEPPATSAVATTTIPEPLEGAVAAIGAQEQAETEAESAEPLLTPGAESRLEAQELAWAEQQVVPAVRDQAMQMILGIAERHTESWPWIVSALDRGDVMFFEALPEPCEGGPACVLRRGGFVEKVWFTLDVLRLEGDFFNPLGASGIVLHELAHLYQGQAKDELRDSFAEHYVGCRVRGEEGTELAEELLADAMALAVLQPDAFERGGFGRYGGPFRGCLRDDDEPAPELIEAIYGALFDCTTLQDDDHMVGGFSLSSGRWGDYAGEGIRRACGVSAVE